MAVDQSGAFDVESDTVRRSPPDDVGEKVAVIRQVVTGVAAVYVGC